MERCKILNCKNGGRFNVNEILFCGVHNKEFKDKKCEIKTAKGKICGNRCSVKINNVFTCRKHKIKQIDIVNTKNETPIIDDRPIGECHICCDTDKRLNILSCSHGFCTECHKAWFKCNKTCPMCRKIIRFEERHLKFKSINENSIKILNNYFKVQYTNETINSIFNTYSNFAVMGESLNSPVLSYSIIESKDVHIFNKEDWELNIAYEWMRIYYNKMCRFNV